MIVVLVSDAQLTKPWFLLNNANSGFCLPLRMATLSCPTTPPPASTRTECSPKTHIGGQWQSVIKYPAVIPMDTNGRSWK